MLKKEISEVSSKDNDSEKDGDKSSDKAEENEDQVINIKLLNTSSKNSKKDDDDDKDDEWKQNRQVFIFTVINSKANTIYYLSQK